MSRSSAGSGGRRQQDRRGPPPARPGSTEPSSSSSSAAAALSRDFEQRLSVGQSSASAAVPARAPAPIRLTPTAATSSSKKQPPLRPGYGKEGRKCLVKANHFLVRLSDSKKLCHYDVSISPEGSSRALGRAVMNQLVTMHKESHLGGRLPVYDGRKSLYTAEPLPFESKDFAITLIDKDESGGIRRERRFKVSLKLAARPDLGHLMHFMSGRQRDCPQETLQVLDIVLRESLSSRYIPVGRSYFSHEFGHPEHIGDGVVCWRGFYQSIRPTQMGLSVNIDVAVTAFYEPLPVIDFVKKLINFGNQIREWSEREQLKIKKALKGLKVVCEHHQHKRKYRISGVSSLPANKLRFPIDDQGHTTTVFQYFRDRYHCSLKYAIWPCLQVGSESRATYLPMEVCKIDEGQKFTRKLNEGQVRAILKSACQRPKQRESDILKTVAHNNYKGDKYAKAFSIEVNDKLATVEARVLPPPELKYSGGGRLDSCRPSLGAWNMINRKMVNGAKVDSWACLNLSRIEPDYVYQFCVELVNKCVNIGMIFGKREPLTFLSHRPDNIEFALKEVDKQCSVKLGGRKVSLLFIVLPEMIGSYGTIKRICDTDLGLVSQCCRPKHVSDIRKQYLENVALKINVKLGGRNTVLADAVARRIPFLTDIATIIFGADVTHPAPGEDSSPSIAAVVASMDWPEVTKYRCLISAQEHRAEIIRDLYKVEQTQKGLVHGGLIRDHLMAYYRATGLKPSRILFYRDGVSEGQFNQVLLEEVDAICKACQSLQSDYLPPITFIVVQKRHHTRLFPIDHGNRDLTDKSGNILPGTVVDTSICHPTEFDFYLCSHAGIQGTSRPTHYHVLWDENKFSADDLQKLTNNLCYTFARCTRSVSLVPAAYYAHLGAFRARYYMESDASESSSSPSAASVRTLPQVKDSVKEFMFFC